MEIFALGMVICYLSIILSLLIVLISIYIKDFLLGLWDERYYIIYQIKELIRGIYEFTLRRNNV